MKAKGRKTTIETVNVDVDAADFLENIYKTSIPRGMDHLGNDGYWYKIDGHDYHKNEELYVKDHPATVYEMRLKEAYALFQKYVSEKHL